MREILFRGKYIQRGLQKHASENTKWVYGSLILRDDYCCILESPKDIHPMDDPYLDGDLGTIDGCATPIDPDTVGQYTGLTDKNGKRIFEGDIVLTQERSDRPYSERRKSKRLTGVVKYQIGDSAHFYNPETRQYDKYCCYSAKWRVDVSNKDDAAIYRCYDWGDFYDCEVIGTIHDNPELLGEKE